MTPQLISIYALVAMFVVATIWPINMGVLAFVGAFLVGTLFAGQKAAEIIDGFPGGLFLTLVGITWLFALAQNNGTIDWLVRLAVRAVKGRIAAIPWIMFGISALLTSVGAVSPGAVAIIAPIALGFAFRYQISPLLMGLMVVHGAQAGGFSPISIYGGITNGVVAEAGLPLSPMTTFGASFFVNAAVALLLFMVLGGRKLLQARSVAPATVNVPHIEIAKPATGPQIFGDSEAEALSRQIGEEAGSRPQSADRRSARRSRRTAVSTRSSRSPASRCSRSSSSPSSSTSASCRDLDRPRPRAAGRRTCRSARCARSPGPRSC